MGEEVVNHESNQTGENQHASYTLVGMESMWNLIVDLEMPL
jgi:hypothetical protein